MPTICIFRGIKIYVNFEDHSPPHFHAIYAGQECSILINEIELMNGEMPNKQLKMILGWTALHQEELIENWNLASKGESTFSIDPLR